MIGIVEAEPGQFIGSNWNLVEVEPPSAARTTDGESFDFADRSVTIQDPDWSDIEHGDGAGA